MELGEGGFLERLRDYPKVRDVVSRSGFDPENPLHIDEAAVQLLRALARNDDPDAFELLVELTEDLLYPAAFAITREIGLAASSEDLVEAFFLGILMDLRRDAGATRHFIARAERTMRRLARERVLELARGDTTPNGGGLVAQMQDSEQRRMSPEERSAAEEQARLQTAFHQLVEMDRRLILLAQTDDQPVEIVADALGLDVLDVEASVDEAWERLQRVMDGTGNVGDNPRRDR